MTHPSTDASSSLSLQEQQPTPSMDNNHNEIKDDQVVLESTSSSSTTTNSPQKWFYYFAYGAMTNPTSRERRGVVAQWAQPAVLHHYRLTFDCGGIGNLEKQEQAAAAAAVVVAPARQEQAQQQQKQQQPPPTEESSNHEEKKNHHHKDHTLVASADKVHGVLMALSPEHWQITCDIEMSYNVWEDWVVPYKNNYRPDTTNEPSPSMIHTEPTTPVRAKFFVLPSSEVTKSQTQLVKAALPQERYLQIIALGLKHHGVDPTYIEQHVLSHECVPKRTPEHYLQFEMDANNNNKNNLPYMTLDEYQKVAHTKHLMIVAGKIVQVLNFHSETVGAEFIKHRLIGQDDLTWMFVNLTYDPDLPLCSSKDELTELHHQWAEDIICENMGKRNLQGKVIARLSSK